MVFWLQRILELFAVEEQDVLHVYVRNSSWIVCRYGPLIYRSSFYNLFIVKQKQFHLAKVTHETIYYVHFLCIQNKSHIIFQVITYVYT